jgi:cysteine desulfurase/selenocysteine lyase
MSTNNNNSQADVELLKQLANQFFKAIPGEASLPAGAQPLAAQGYHSPYQGYLTDAGNLNTRPPDLHMATPVAMPSISGAGVSPGSVAKHVNQIDPIVIGSKNTDNYTTNPYGAIDEIPASMGSANQGGSLPYVNYSDTKNTEPAISHSNYFGTGKVPQSLAGSGVSPGFKTSSGETGNLPDALRPLTTQDYNPLPYQGYLNEVNPYISPPDPHIVTPLATPSFSGAGVSPGPAAQHVNNIDLKNADNTIVTNPFGDIDKIPASVGSSNKGSMPSANYFDTKNTEPAIGKADHIGAGKVPQSVAGSGKSPSAPHQYTDFNINDPQTSLPDPHFADGKVPKSVAGSGKSPSLQNQNKPVAKEELPYSNDNSFENGLAEALSSINSFVSTPQLPTSFEQSSFYFLPKGDPFRFANNNSISPDGLLANKAQAGAPPLDVNLIKKDFPILQERVNGRPLIWLDNAATTQKPRQVIDRISYFYEHENSNIHRAAHELAARATDAFEAARGKVQRFLNAASPNEIVFVRGTTEAINLVAKSWGEQYLQAGDEIIITHLEHHANIIPWQQLAAKNGLKIKVIPVDDDGQILPDEYAKLLGPKVKLVSFAHVSNALGTITPAKQIIDMAHHAGAKVLLDGAQSVSHMRVDLQQLNPDWFVFSGHKIYGPTGIGVVYGKEDLLNETQPWQGGGNMIKNVTFEHTTFQDAPGRFEAGTGNIADAVGLGAAIDYVSKIGIDLIDQYEHYLLLYATRLLKQVPGLRLIGTAPDKASVLSFVLDGYKTEDVGTALNKEGIAVRAGHHCAQPILRRFGVETTVRPSLAFYNTCADVDKLFNTLINLKRNP